MGRDEAVPAREQPRATTSTPVSVASPPAPRQADIPTVTVPWWEAEPSASTTPNHHLHTPTRQPGVDKLHENRC
jgi:hypothetical protein